MFAHFSNRGKSKIAREVQSLPPDCGILALQGFRKHWIQSMLRQMHGTSTRL